MGILLLRSAELPLMRAMDNFWKRREISWPSSSPVCLALALPSFLICATPVLCQAPRTRQLEGQSKYPPGCRLPRTCLAFACELHGGRDLESLLRLLKRIYDCAIQSTVLALVHMREEDVSWFPTLAWQQCSTLPCGTQACS